uniref:G_PROTEIN_RECEP_F1_2 domain-containing protein n=1 Tax=Globodera pallida TaxID=36090 RepID=A0A183CT60_GLOPA
MAIADPSISPLIAFLAFFVYAPLCLITLLLNLLSIAVLAHGHRYFSQKFFFIVGRHLLAADLLSTTAQLLVAVPVTVMATESAKSQMLLFGFVPCAKRFDPLTLHFFDSCYWSSANQRGSGSALLNIWLSVLLCT